MPIQAAQIGNLLAIARSGSFTKAAELKGMSQPALSNSIALLERQLGVKVLERTRRGSLLTPYGEILVRRAEGLETLLRNAETEVKRSAAGIAGPLRIGATPSVLTWFMPRALSKLLKTCGPVDIEVIEHLDETLEPMLRSGELDIVVGPVGEMFTNSSEISEVRLVDDRFMVAVGEGSALAGKTEITLAELQDAPWILPRHGSSYRIHVEALFRSRRVPWPTDCVLSNSTQLIEQLILDGSRLAIVTPMQMLQRPGVVMISLDGEPGRFIGYKVRDIGKLSPIGKAFVEHLQEQAATV